MPRLSAPQTVSLGSTIRIQGSISGSWVKVAGGLKPPARISIEYVSPEASCTIISGGFKFNVNKGYEGSCKVEIAPGAYDITGVLFSIFGSSDVEGVLKVFRKGEEEPIHRTYFSGEFFGGIINIPIGLPKPSALIFEAYFPASETMSPELTVSPIFFSIIGSPEEFAFQLQADNAVTFPIKIGRTVVDENKSLDVMVEYLILSRPPTDYSRLLLIVPPHISKVTDEIYVEYGQPAYAGNVSAEPVYYSHKPLVYVFNVEAELIYAYYVPSAGVLNLHLFSGEGVPYSTRLFNIDLAVNGEVVFRNHIGRLAELVEVTKQVTGPKTLKVNAKWRVRHGSLPSVLSMMVSYASTPVFFLFKPPPPMVLSIDAPEKVEANSTFTFTVSETAICDLGDHSIPVSIVGENYRWATTVQFSSKSAGSSEDKTVEAKAPPSKGYVMILAYDLVSKTKASKLIEVV